jgi:hypothetical protein
MHFFLLVRCVNGRNLAENQHVNGRNYGSSFYLQGSFLCTTCLLCLLCLLLSLNLTIHNWKWRTNFLVFTQNFCQESTIISAIHMLIFCQLSAINFPLTSLLKLMLVIQLAKICQQKIDVINFKTRIKKFFETKFSNQESFKTKFSNQGNFQYKNSNQVKFQEEIFKP